MSNVRVELHSETATGNKPATVKVFDGEKLVTTVVAEVRRGQGADGGFYPVVELNETKNEVGP